ncbi:MAG: hypothetical protein AAF462_05455 [Thermodesulfobacteriota bacterium]
MNTKKMKFTLKMVICTFFISILAIGGCDVEFGGGGDSGGGSGNGSIIGDVVLEGQVLNFAEFGTITVTAEENNFRLDRTTADAEGNFRLQFRASTGTIDVDLRFESDSFDAERPNIMVVGNSTTILDITLEQNPSIISIDRWQVFQDIISLINDTVLDFAEDTVEFNIDGNGGNCLTAGGTVSITYQVKSINITDCREGIRAQSGGAIILQADEGIVVSSTQDTIITFDDGSVEIGQSTNPIDNTVTISSENQFGINAGGSSVVTINPENECSISGGRDAINEFGTGSVSTSICTLSS